MKVSHNCYYSQAISDSSPRNWWNGRN